MNNIRSTLATVWRIAVPYFRSEDKWAGRALLAAVVSIELALVAIDVLLNQWSNRFFNALQEYNWDVFVREIGVFSLLATCFIALAVYQLYLNQWLQIRWRSWMTKHYLGEWMDTANHYRMQLQGDAADNPDQRITDDVKLFVSQTLALGVGLLQLDRLAGILCRHPLGIVSGSTAGAVRHRFHHPRLSGGGRADLRHLRHRVDAVDRLAAGQPRFQPAAAGGGLPLQSGAGARELRADRAAEGRARRTRAAVAAILPGHRQLVRHHEPHQAADGLHPSYAQAAVIIPFALVSPAYFANKIQLGALTQTAEAFGQVQDALSFFVTAYRTMAEWRAVVARLDGFESSITQRRRRSRPIWLDRQCGHAAGARSTCRSYWSSCRTVHRWSRPTISACVPANARSSPVRPAPASRPCSAPSPASGRSARARSRFPPTPPLMMLPQRPYLPIGTLHAAIVYPSEDAKLRRRQGQASPREVGLPRFAPRLDEEAHWNRMLSLGEQQRLGLARALLHTPSHLFLDEATASLDEPSEAALYTMLTEKLPQTTIVSIGHRATLEAFHERNVTLGARRRPLYPAGGQAGMTARSRFCREAYNQRRGHGWRRTPRCQSIGERGQQHRAGQHRRQQERRRQIARHHQQRVDARRRVKGPGHVHRQNGNADGGGRGPALRPGQLQHGEADQRRYQMTADQGARLRRLHVRRSDHQHDRGGERNHRERIMRGEREQLHHADGDGAAQPATAPATTLR